MTPVRRSEPPDSIYLPDRAGWRAWLQEHHTTSTGIWLIYFRSGTRRPRVAYEDAVEEALCFGWIDSTVRSVDDERFAQRFTPRRRGSNWSQPNRERLRKLLAAGLVAPHLVPEAERVAAEPFAASDDLLQALRADADGWAHFQRFSGPYQRIRIAFVEAGRDRPDEFQRRLRHLLRMNAAGKQFGHGIDSFLT